MTHKINKLNKNKCSKGFTLIEVLLASFILFLVISSITIIYRGALLSSSKAERALQLSSMVVPVSEQIRIKLQSPSNNEYQGQGMMGAVSFVWSAEQAFQSNTPVSFDNETGVIISNNKMIRLWHIHLQLQLGKTSRQYFFNEVSW